MKFRLDPTGETTYEVQVREVTSHEPDLIAKVLEIDLMTFSEPTFSRYTAGLLLRHGRTFLLLVDGQVVGTAQCLRSWDRPQEAVLFCMAIRPGWRGRGLGAFFLQRILEALARSGLRSVVLEVEPGNRKAVRLYQEMGFRTVARCAEEYGPGHDRLHLRLDLQPPPVHVVRAFPGESPVNGRKPHAPGDAPPPRAEHRPEGTSPEPGAPAGAPIAAAPGRSRS